MNDNNPFNIPGIEMPSITEQFGLDVMSHFNMAQTFIMNPPRNGKKKATLIPDGLNVREYKEFAEKLAKENADLKSHKRFGLVWEDIPDEQVDKLNKAIPLLIEDTNKAVITNESDTNHILINGDNFHALTALRTSHLGKINVIYIDPPYNTGNKDFIYNDNYVDKEDGYYHSKWLSFMEKRLILAKELLNDSGVIFVSIDDNEQARLKLLMDSVFGEGNFVTNLIWKKKQGGGNDSANFVTEHEYVLVYTKTSSFTSLLDSKHQIDVTMYPFEDENGRYSLIRLDKSSLGYIASLDFEIEDYEGNKYSPRVVGGSKSRWRWSKKKVEAEKEKLVFRNGGVYTKAYMPIAGIKPKSLLVDPRFGRSESGGSKIKAVLGKGKFSFPKPVELIQHLLRVSTNPNAIVLDFFAGSGTTAHAVAELNKEDGGNRQCILVTDGGKTETVGQSAKNAKNTTVNIAEEITYERVRRVLTGQNWADGKEHEPLGGNLRYFKIEMENVEGLTTDDQKGLFQHNLINHAMIAENTFIKVLSKQDNLDSLYPQAYNVLTNSDKSKYLVVIEAHDHKLKELKAFLDTIDDNTEVILIGERIDKINWVKNNKGEYRIDNLLDKMIENRLSILNSSVFN